MKTYKFFIFKETPIFEDFKINIPYFIYISKNRSPFLISSLYYFGTYKRIWLLESIKNQTRNYNIITIK